LTFSRDFVDSATFAVFHEKRPRGTNLLRYSIRSDAGASLDVNSLGKVDVRHKNVCKQASEPDIRAYLKCIVPCPGKPAPVLRSAKFATAFSFYVSVI
jgi:hypothetical protein